MNIRKIMPDINKHLDESMEPIQPDPMSHEGLIVPEIILKYGSLRGKIRDLPTMTPYMIKCIFEMKKSYREMKSQPNPGKKTISDLELTNLISYIKSLGMSDIGFVKVAPSNIFLGKVILFDSAIVIALEMKHDPISTAPSGEAGKEIYRTYMELGKAVNKISGYLKELGFKAEAGPALGGETNYPLLAEKAGIGAIGKHGMLITPLLGPSLRLAAVYTNIENLPAPKENIHNWIKDFCNKCNKCVRRCPAGAIYEDTKVFDDGTEEHIDFKKCALPFSNDHGCTVCIKECLFFSQGYDKIKSTSENKFSID